MCCGVLEQAYIPERLQCVVGTPLRITKAGQLRSQVSVLDEGIQHTSAGVRQADAAGKMVSSCAVPSGWFLQQNKTRNPVTV